MAGTQRQRVHTTAPGAWDRRTRRSAAPASTVVALLVVCLLAVGAVPERANAATKARAAAEADLVDPTYALSWGTTFHPVTPTRILDSRTPLGGFGGPLGTSPKELTVAGVAGVGAADNLSAVVLNVTVTEGTAPSFLSVLPSGSVPTTSTINFAPRQTVANAVTVKVDATGKVRFANAAGAVHVVADVTGWYDNPPLASSSTGPPGTLYNAVGPTRLLDSRTSIGGWNHGLGPGEENIAGLQVAGGNGIPLTARAVALNVTATGSDAGSFVQVWPSDAPRPTSSSVNFGPGQTIANQVTSSLSATGRLSFFNAVGSTHLVVDVLGYYDPTQGANFHPVAPTRVLDDRTGSGLTGPWGPAQSRSFPVAGTHDIPAGATGIVGNVTVTNGSANTFVTLRRTDSGGPSTSTVNAGAHETIANAAFTSLDATGHASIFNAAGSLDVVLDVAGYFDGDARARPVYLTSSGPAGAPGYYQLGSSTPIVASPPSTYAEVPADYDGDGRWDVAFVNAGGDWITLGTAGTLVFPRPSSPVPTSTGKFVMPVPGVYDGGSKAIPAWYRDWDGMWFIQGHDPIQFGEGPTDTSLPSGTKLAQTDQDVPAPADYDGDGITDLATFRPLTARWMVRRSSDHAIVTFTLGKKELLTFPVPADYDGVGHAQAAAYDGVSAWWISGRASPSTFGAGDWGLPGPADYTGVGHAQLAYIPGSAYPTSGPWKVEGFAAGIAPAANYARPVTFPAALNINVARMTMINRCAYAGSLCST